MASAAVTQAAGTGQVTALPVRPTVFIGLGGTGMEVLLRLRRRILAERWNGQQLKSIGDFPIAAFLYFDTDQRATAQSDIKSDEDPFLSLISLDGEAIRPKDFRPGKFQSNIDNYPTLRDWLPTQSLSGVDTSQGAGQIRAISRLLFFDQVKNFDAEVRKRANMVTANLSNQRSLTELGLAPDKNLRAVVVAGLGGGTGAGSFIDVGLFLRQVSGPEFGEVDAYLMLPSGFAKHGTRTLANGFAALTELEHAMRKQSPPYATRWGVGSEAFKPSLDANRQRPFSDVYLFDVANIAGNRSEHVEPIYEMMADSLFEDFGTSGFADRKRSARVNRIGAKDRGFRPDAIDGDTSVRGFAFSTAYSALGQSRLTTRGTLAIDEAAEVAVQDMLKSFFGVALPGDRRTAQAPDRDRFLNEALRLAPCVYDDFPKHLKPRPAAVSARQLVDTILGAAGRPLDAQLVDDIHRAFDAMRAALASPGDWVAQARELHRQYKAEVLPQAGVEAIREKKVGEARTALARLWFSNDTRRGSGSLLDALFERVDDRERGGVDFTIGLIEDVRAALERPDGPIGRLTSAAEDLEAVAETLHERQFDMALDSIEKSLKGGMFGRADIVSAESYLKSAGECLADGLAFRLRARAAREGAALLRDAIEKLGRQTADSEGRTKYSGLLGKLHDYRAAVEGLIGDAGREQRKIANRVGLDSSGTALVVEDGSGKTPFAKVDLEAATWADESFRSLGQCRALLPKLEKGDENFNILNTLRNSARAKLDVLREDMPTISDALAALPEGQSDRLLEQLMSRAMPWIEPAPDSDFKPDSINQYQMLLATGDRENFAGQYQGRLTNLAPTGLQPQLVATGSPNELICYCELSGYPLDWLVGMRGAWKQEYQQNLLGESSNPYPVHVHRDPMRFAMPLVPTGDEVRQLKFDLALLLRATMLGVVQRRDSGEWQINIAAGRQPSWSAIGTEAEIRRRSIAPMLRAKLETQVAAKEVGRGPAVLTALINLADQLAHDYYAPQREDRGQGEEEVYGFGHKVALAIVESWRSARSAVLGDDAASVAGWEDWLNRNRDKWSEAIPGSQGEAVRETGDQMVFKRRLRDAVADETVLRAMMAPPVAQPAAAWWLLEDNLPTGPFGLDQLVGMLGSKFAANSLLCPVGGAGWQSASDIDGVKGLLTPPPPPPPPPPK